MPFKRTRTGTENEPAPSTTTAAVSAAVAVKLSQNQTKPVADSSQQSVAAINEVKLAEFLERCHYCKKRIPDGAEVFMYRDFCAFCSVGCRDMQISLDKLAEKQPVSSNGMAVQCQEMKDGKSHHGC